MAILKNLASHALSLPGNILFPPVCAGCRRHVSEAGALCGACWPELRFLEQPWCRVLGTPFRYDMGADFLSAEAIAEPPPFDRARAAVAYTGVARQMVQNLKYGDRIDLAACMARWMVRAGAELIEDAQLIVPVPLFWRRFFLRRFNQAAELSRAISTLTGLPFLPEAVERVKATRRQVGLSALERQENVRSAFLVPAQREIAVRGRRVLVIDDVYTTGATAWAVTRALQRGGAAAVDVLTFARVLPGDFQAADQHLI